MNSQIEVTSKAPVIKPKPAAEPPKADIKIPTAEELKQRATDLYASMGWETPPEPNILKPEELRAATGAPEEPTAPAAGTPPATDDQTPPPAAATEDEPAPPMTSEELISRTASETAQAVAQALNPPAPTAPKDTAPDLTDDDRQDLDTIRYLESTDQKYRGLADRYLKFVHANYAYVEKWLAANPDKEFNPDDPEHEAFYAENQPDIDRKVLDTARIEMISDRKAEEKIRQKVEPQLQAQRAEKAFREHLPAIAGQINSKIVDMVRAVDPEMLKLLTDDQGNVLLDEAHINQVREKSPMAHDVIDEIIRNDLEPMILELEKTMVPGMNYKLSPKTNPVHAEIANFVRSRESDLAKAKPADQVIDGKRWMSLSDYAAAANKIMEGTGTQEQKGQQLEQLDRTRWTLTTDMIEDLMVDFHGKRAVKILDRTRKLAEKEYGPARKDASGAPSGTITRPAVPSLSSGQKPSSPTASGQSDIVTANTKAGGGKKTWADEATDVAFSR